MSAEDRSFGEEQAEMSITKSYAVICTKDLERAKGRYNKLFGRQPDPTPMAQVHEWYLATEGFSYSTTRNNPVGRSSR